MIATDLFKHDVRASSLRNAAVYNVEGRRIGHIEDVSLDRVSGQTHYAWVSLCAFLGDHDNLWPLPWALLRYDTQRNGYILPLSKKILSEAPSFDRDAITDDLNVGEAVESFYCTVADI